MGKIISDALYAKLVRHYVIGAELTDNEILFIENELSDMMERDAKRKSYMELKELREKKSPSVTDV